MGTYGFIRFSLPLLPQGTLWATRYVVILSIIGIVYAALVTLVQSYALSMLIGFFLLIAAGRYLLGLY